MALLFIKIIIPNEFKIFTSVMMRFIQSKNYDGYKCYYQKQTDKDNDKHDKINENVPPRNENSSTVRHTSNVPQDTPTRHANKTPQTRHFNNITIRSSKQSLIYQHLYTTSQQWRMRKVVLYITVPCFGYEQWTSTTKVRYLWQRLSYSQECGGESCTKLYIIWSKNYIKCFII